MSDPFGHRPFPRAPLIAAAAVIALSLAAAATARLERPASGTPQAPVVVTRDLRFEDRPDHAIIVCDIRGEQPIAVIPPGTNGFLRAALRGLARDRKRNGSGGTAPFRLTAFADGRLTLEDTVTGDRVELEAFGRTNEAAFAGLLTAGKALQ